MYVTKFWKVEHLGSCVRDKGRVLMTQRRTKILLSKCTRSNTFRLWEIGRGFLYAPSLLCFGIKECAENHFLAKIGFSLVGW